MADFTAYPALSVATAQPNQAFTMAQQAAQINGMTLDQHFKRLQAAAGILQGYNLDNNGAGISKSDWNGMATTAMKQGILNPTEAAQLVASGTDDPIQNAKIARTLYAGITGHMEAIAPAFSGVQTGAGTLFANSNPGSAGGSTLPGSVTTGLSAADLASPATWTDPQTGQAVQGTVGQKLAAMHVGTAPVVAGNAFPTMGRATGGPQGAPALSQGPMSPQNALMGAGNTNALSGPPMPPQGAPLSMGNMMAANPVPVGGAPVRFPTGVPAGNMLTPGAPPISPPPPPPPPQVAPAMMPQAAPGAGGAPMAGISPDLIKASSDAYSADLATASEVPKDIAQLQELQAAAAKATIGPASNNVALVQGLANEFGLQWGADAASQKAVMDKITNTLASSGLTDFSKEINLRATPNSNMPSLDAIRTTSAILLGQKLFQQQVMNEAQARGVSPGNYTTFKQQFQQQGASPLVLSMKYMPDSGRKAVIDYWKTLPKADQFAIARQLQSVQ